MCQLCQLQRKSPDANSPAQAKSYNRFIRLVDKLNIFSWWSSCTGYIDLFNGNTHAPSALFGVPNSVEHSLRLMFITQNSPIFFRTDLNISNYCHTMGLISNISANLRRNPYHAQQVNTASHLRHGRVGAAAKSHGYVAAFYGTPHLRGCIKDETVQCYPGPLVCSTGMMLHSAHVWQ